MRNLPQIPSLKMNHLSPTNAGNSIITPQASNMRSGMQSLTIETGNVQSHPQQKMPTGATSPSNAGNNPQLRYKNESMFNNGAIVGIHHPASTKAQNSRQINLKRSMAPPGSKGQGSAVGASSNMQFEMVQNMGANHDNEVRSLDRVVDMNHHGENSLAPKRTTY